MVSRVPSGGRPSLERGRSELAVGTRFALLEERGGWSDVPVDEVPYHLMLLPLQHLFLLLRPLVLLVVQLAELKEFAGSGRPGPR